MGGELLAHAQRLERLREVLAPHLPAELNEHCQLANFRESTLIFVADDPLWATRLRQLNAAILHAALTYGKVRASRVEVRIDPDMKRAETPHRAPRPLPPAAREQLDRAAAASDGDLAAAMRRLARKGS